MLCGVSCLLFVVGCLLIVVCCLSRVARCVLFVVRCWLLVVGRLLFSAWCGLLLGLLYIACLFVD